MTRATKSAAKQPYESVAHELADRIFDLIEGNPKILEITEPFDLFGVPGFHCADLGPSLFQAGWALTVAKRRFRSEDDQ